MKASGSIAHQSHRWRNILADFLFLGTAHTEIDIALSDGRKITVDRGIAEIVYALNEAGFRTRFSCQGSVSLWRWLTGGSCAYVSFATDDAPKDLVASMESAGFVCYVLDGAVGIYGSALPFDGPFVAAGAWDFLRYHYGSHGLLRLILTLVQRWVEDRLGLTSARFHRSINKWTGSQTKPKGRRVSGGFYTEFGEATTSPYH